MKEDIKDLLDIWIKVYISNEVEDLIKNKQNCHFVCVLSKNTHRISLTQLIE